ncbi:MAG: hypothetical protein BIFFINMI_03490 [Phycisphaerae bacterium]|nr:hypothetical protein [Phycisphaerae bacterium]
MPKTAQSRSRRRRWIAAGAPVALLIALGAALSHAGYGCRLGCEPEQTTINPAAAPGVSEPQAPADLMIGQWAGQWSTQSGDDSGTLQCTVRRIDESSYGAKFHATFFKVLTHDSEVTLRVTREPGKWLFEGEKDLGLLSGGIYRYKGYVTVTEFYSTFDSKMYKGIYRMKRVAATTQPAARSD